jgi:hypothetical protein
MTPNIFNDPYEDFNPPRFCHNPGCKRYNVRGKMKYHQEAIYTDVPSDSMAVRTTEQHIYGFKCCGLFFYMNVCDDCRKSRYTEILHRGMLSKITLAEKRGY